MQHLKAYLLQCDFEAVAQRIAEAVNNASPDLSAEKKELSEINKKIANGVKAVLNGMEFPELQNELSLLRVRKTELEDIIARKSVERGVVDKDKIVKVFEASASNWDTDLKNIIKAHVTRIYAHADGSYSVNVGVHISGCGGWI